MDASAVSDSTDWLSTPLAGLAPLDSSLRCQVCKDFFTTPMITSCSHTFCSLCIRRYLSQEGRCPACREPDQEVKLRRNWAVEELVANFESTRQEVLRFAQKAVQKAQDEIASESRPVKRRKVADTKEPNGVRSERRSTRSQTKRDASQTGASQRSPTSAQNEVADSEAGSVYEDEPISRLDGHSDPEPSDGLVACPNCSRRLKEAQINSHLDKCLAGEATPPAIDKPTSQSPHPPQIVSGTIAYAQTKPSTSNRLPFLNYALLNDNAMRKKLKELGIPSSGSKELMRKRHMEWLNLWNANCDSLKPVSKLQLLKDLSTWERTLGRQVERGQQANGVMVKDFDRDRYAQKQKSDFDDLIARARQSQAAKKVETSLEIEERRPVNGSTQSPIDLDEGTQLADEVYHPPPIPYLLDAGGHELNPQREDGATSMIQGTSVPAFDCLAAPPGDYEERAQQSPPSSQRQMSRDVTA